jgi:hypothetical protein
MEFALLYLIAFDRGVESNVIPCDSFEEQGRAFVLRA